MSQMMTPIKQLKSAPQQQVGQQQQQQVSQEQKQFSSLPEGEKIPTEPVTKMIPTGQSQGVSIPETSRKEFFGMSINFKDMILVFALFLIVASGIYAGALKGATGSIGYSSDGITIIGGIIVAFIATLIYLIVHVLGKF